MLLKALTDYYDQLVELGHVPPYDMMNVNVGFAIALNDDGTISKIVSLKQKSEDGKKEINVKRQVSKQTARSGKRPKPYFLSDTLQHIYGVSLDYDNDKNAKAEHHYQINTSRNFYADDFKALHHEILDGCDSPAAKTILKFIDSIQSDPSMFPQIITDNLEMLNDYGMQPQIILRDRNGNDFIEEPSIRRAWDKYLDSLNADSPVMIDLISGESANVAELHGGIRGLGGPANGVSLVSYNKDAFESFGHKHGENSPVSIANAHKYTSVLNYLYAQREYVTRIGDSSNPSVFITYWSENGSTVYQDIFGDEFDYGKRIDRDDLKAITDSLVQGKPIVFHEEKIDPNEKFYVLGMGTNSARASVQFFYENTFGKILKNVTEHNERLRIVGAINNQSIPIYRILSETVRQIGLKLESNPSPSITAGLYLSVLKNYRYPDAIYTQVLARINADRDIKYAKAEIIKAYLLKNGTKVPKEVLTVAVNTDSNYAPYVLGRVFAVLEKIQKDVSPGITTTLKDRYIARAASDPVLVFPGLLRLSQNHQRKLSKDSRIYYSNMLNDLLGRLPETFPKHLSLEEQGSFYLGYYHENQFLYQSKADKEDK
ncbi:MAG: type I-C CRISPR-associated protein Cas8c/Csd1 [Lactimicrobium massiliense]|nr:type I-C CRISPR-associated protein Cas8c/Csd1 [Lactimicrobium massiliense]MDD6559975.1 type I-C CRISPR-associated protein Cas8c/Csd1 [Lactimicrobium massiliense]